MTHFGWRGFVDHYWSHVFKLPGRRRVCDWYERWLDPSG